MIAIIVRKLSEFGQHGDRGIHVCAPSEIEVERAMDRAADAGFARIYVYRDLSNSEAAL